MRRLQLVTLEGVNWLGGVTLGHNDRALGRVVSRTEFWARLPAGVAVQPGISTWRAGAPLAVKRRGEGSGVGRMIDVRRAVVLLDAPQAGVATDRVVEALEWDLLRTTRPSRQGRRCQPRDRPAALVRFQLAVTTEGSAKPIEVVEALWGPEVAARAAIARVGLWAADSDRLRDPLGAPLATRGEAKLIDPLDAEALRQSAQEMAAADDSAELADQLSGDAAASAAGRPPALSL